MSFNQIGIIGCGWLGLPLAQYFIDSGKDVIATARSEERLAELSAESIANHALSLPESVQVLAQLPVFSQQAIVIAIPPQIKRGVTDYPDKIANIVAAAELAAVKRLILISSTAATNGLSGDVTEFTPLNTEADKVAIIAEAERIALSFNGDSRVLRLAGLVGPKRHPGRFLSAERLLTGAEEPVNLIHQVDVIGLIDALVKLEDINQHATYHGVSQTHSTKQDFYRQAAQTLKRSTPKFVQQDQPLLNRIINDDWTRTQLAYSYQYDDLIAWLNTGI